MYFIVSYRRVPGTRFDSRYYVEQHIPLVEKTWKPFGLDYIDAFFPSREDSDVIVVAMCRFKDRAALDAALAAEETAIIMADIEKYTDSEPDRHVTEVFQLSR
ncbi:EthD family reductase [Burkholderia gladioli]|uniref:EthD family reductase n=1 Tax=Burkholderia gladioli TaxID=28095 RepID=UPI00163F71C5|nr:EthD family reductase [Burkholderia gladioli]MBJ9662817.1 EthD family reductase [Burkholderia gladioli]